MVKDSGLIDLNKLAEGVEIYDSLGQEYKQLDLYESDKKNSLSSCIVGCYRCYCVSGFKK